MTDFRSPLLRVSGLSTSLGKVDVLQNLTLPDLSAGSLVALLGPNGCGKSTLLKSIAGLIPSSCDVLSAGDTDLRAQDAATRSEILRYLPQSAPDTVHLTVREAVMIAYRARNRARPHPDVHTRIDALLHDLNIAHLRHHYLDQLSGGQRQLASLAQALIHKPMLLLLDEPLTSLDMNYQIHVMRFLAKLTHEQGVTAIVVLHDLDMALRYADHALLLHQSGLLASGTPASVFIPENLAHAFSVHTRLEHDSQGQLRIFVDDTLRL